MTACECLLFCCVLNCKNIVKTKDKHTYSTLNSCHSNKKKKKRIKYSSTLNTRNRPDGRKQVSSAHLQAPVCRIYVAFLSDPVNREFTRAVHQHTHTRPTHQMTQSIQIRIKVSNHCLTTPLQRSRRLHRPNHQTPSLSMI